MEELVKRAIKRDDNAFDELILKVQKELYLIASSKLSSQEDIADAMQETILLAYKHLKKLKDVCYFKTWIIKILINECNKMHRKKANKREISYEKNEFENYYNEVSFEDLDFESLISSLKDDEKTIITLYYYSGYTTKEISKILKMNESTIRSKLSRAKIKLKNRYEGGYDE